jgi:Domain of unknown function (DUF397)
MPLMKENWRKASYSINNGQCVEAGHGSNGIGVRDTTEDDRADRVVLEFSAPAWEAFTRKLKA